MFKELWESSGGKVSLSYFGTALLLGLHLDPFGNIMFYFGPLILTIKRGKED